MTGVTEHGASLPAPLAPEVRIGTELAGYRLEELVGQGGMGAVYRAEHLHLGRTVALKLLLPEREQDDGFRERFVREARTAASLQHPNIVVVYDAGQAADLLYIAMQYVDGTDLGAVLASEGALEATRALAILGQVAEALDAAHARGIVHRDVKPGNVLIDDGRAYLTDFGLTKAVSQATSLTVQGQFVGTLEYMAPEQIAGDPVDPRTDVYALGCVLYHCLTGVVPYERESQVSVIYAHLQDAPAPLRSRRPGIPEALDPVIGKALAKKSEERYGSCGELIAAARAAIGAGGPPSTAAPPPARSLENVLVADGDASVRAMARVSLRDTRTRVLEAENGERALELARQERPALLLVDWKLPGIDGPAVCKALRSDPRTAEVKIVALSSRGELDDRAAHAGGADDHLAKPFSSLRLLYAVRDALGQDVLSG